MSAANDELAAITAEFCDVLGRYVQDRIDPLEVDRSHGLPEGVLEELGEMGAFGVSLPEEYGGAGLGLTGACAVVERIARHDRGVATTVGLHLGLGTRGLVAFGTDAQKERWLPQLASGERVGAFATTEPGSGSDLTKLATKAQATEGGIQVDGEKIWVTNGGLAKFYTMTVSSPGLGGAKRGQSIVLLEREDAGLTVGAEEDKLGLRGSSTTTVVLDEVRVPADRILGEPGQGQRYIHHILGWGRTAMAAGCLGTARGAFDKAVRHVAMREQFGGPLLTQPVIREQLADAKAELFAMDALVADTAALGEDVQALEVLSLATKIFASEADWRVCDLSVQLHGGMGYIEESGIPLYLRDARITRIFEGANDVLAHRLGAAEVMMKSARTPLGMRADRLADAVAELKAGWKKTFKMKLLRDAPRLHRLGRLVVLREASDAAAKRALTLGTDVARDLAERFARLAEAEAHGLFADRIDDGAARERIVESLVAEVRL